VVIRSGFRRTVVQLYVSSKTQNAHNFGHGYATDPYFTFLRMAKKVFLIKFLWHRRDSNPRPVGDHFLQFFRSLMLNHHGYIWRRNLHYFAAKTGRGARPMGVSPPNGLDGCFCNLHIWNQREKLNKRARA
jgi:hypothetical protein